MKKTIFLIIAAIAFVTSITMYSLGKGNDNLTELYDTFWLPLPVGGLFLLLGLLTKNKPK